MKVAIVAWTAIAGAPWNQFHCLKKYTSLNVRLINQRITYADQRRFPHDLFFSNERAQQWIKQADVVHIHNYLPLELQKLLNKNRQLIVATLHSCPRQGTWKELSSFAHKTYTIRQPMQMREYKGFDTLPNLFDVWGYHTLNRGVENLKIVYAPTSKGGLSLPSSKGYPQVLPILKKFTKEHEDISLVHFDGMEYKKNLERKRQCQIVVDDVCPDHKTFHLTSIEGAVFGQAILTSQPEGTGYPFVETTINTLEKTLEKIYNNRRWLALLCKQSREWAEDEWDPKKHVDDYLRAYGIKDENLYNK